MPGTTTNYGLIVYNATTDAGEPFLNFRNDIAGDVSSNMIDIDADMKDIQDQVDLLAVSSGGIPVNGIYSTPGNYTATVAAITAYVTGMIILLKLDTTAAESSTTLNINSLGTKTLKKVYAAGTQINVSANNLIKNRQYYFQYDGTYWVWISGTSGDQISISGTTNNLVKIGSGLIDSGVAVSDILTPTNIQPENLLINGGFDICQRYTPASSSLLVSEGGYFFGADRWRIEKEAGNAYYQRNSAISEVGLTSKYYGTYKTGSISSILIAQSLESPLCIALRGKTVTFKISMKAASSNNITIGLIEARTSADSVRSIVDTWASPPTLGAGLYYISSNSFGLSTDWTTYTVYGTIPTTCLNLYVAIWSDGDFAALDTIDLAEASLTTGYGMTFSWYSKLISQELLDCQRYYEKSYDIDIPPGTDLSAGRPNGLIGTCFDASKNITGTTYKVKKRTTPTSVIYADDGTAASAYDLTGAARNAVAAKVDNTDGIFSITLTDAIAKGDSAIYFYSSSAEF